MRYIIWINCTRCFSALYKKQACFLPFLTRGEKGGRINSADKTLSQSEGKGVCAVLFDTKLNRIKIGCRELVRLAREGASPYTICDEDIPYAHAYGNLKNKDELSLELSFGGIDFLLSGDMPHYARGELTLEYPVSEGLYRGKPRASTAAMARGEAFILAYMLSRPDVNEESSILIKIHYFNPDSEREVTLTEEVKSSALLRFFDRCMSSILPFAEAECERVRVRLPSMKSAKFPYPERRGGQSDFIKAAYRAIARGGELFAMAPTGTGKTVSALFPAIRALGDGRVEKVFYLTPKTTTAEAAKDCIADFTKNGVSLRAMILSAKDRSCAGELVCRKNKRLCPALEKNRLREALFCLYREGLPTAELKDFKRVGKLYTVCPYELSLAYAELCDIIVCDFNYVFDPQVYIRRFFDRGGSYAFLIDEAHNLGERAREMYSAELDTGSLLALHSSPLLGPYSEAKRASLELYGNFRRVLYPIIADEVRVSADGGKIGAYGTAALPSEIYSLFDSTLEICEDELKSNLCAEDGERDDRVALLRGYIHQLNKFRNAAIRFDEGFRLLLFYEKKRSAGGESEGDILSESLRARIFCIDTGAVLRQRLALGRSAVFFSGTLTPAEYFRDTLGGDRSSEILRVSSPFVPEQLAVGIFDSISTRFNQREDTLIDICRVISATMGAKRGHYMIFTPSFAYTEELYKTFKETFPKIPAIVQKPNMTAAEKKEFLASFTNDTNSFLAAFCVTGGIYGEGIDLPGNRLIGAIVIGIGMPTPSFERETIAAYYDEKTDEGKLYAYIYPGMNKVLQAAGRVIRSENDRGVIVLIDDRFADPIYKDTAPALWQGMTFYSKATDLNRALKDFWDE